MDYVLGFVFHNDDYVLLIEKQKPAWQKGKLNGIGGKIEVTADSGIPERPAEAMARECREETGLDIPEPAWRHYATMVFDQDSVYVFSTVSNFNPNDLTEETGTGETLWNEEVTNVLLGLTYKPAMGNLPWLIAMSRDPGFGGSLTVNYNEANG